MPVISLPSQAMGPFGMPMIPGDGSSGGGGADGTYGALTKTVNWNTIKGSVASTVDSSFGFNPSGYTFNNDGTRMYVCTRTWVTGMAYDSAWTQVSIAQYHLSTAYDISTATYNSISNTRYVEQLMGINDIIWNDDGTKLFIAMSYESSYTPSSNRYQIWECACSSAYDVSGINVASPTSVMNLPLLDARSLTFSNDGTKLFAAADTSGIFIATLSTAYSLSGATTSTISSTSLGLGNNLRLWGISFSDDGKTAFITQGQAGANNQQWKLTLATAYDLTSYSNTETLTIGDVYVYDKSLITFNNVTNNVTFGSFSSTTAWKYNETGPISSSGGGGGGASQGWISTISDEIMGYGYNDLQIHSLAVDSNDNIIAAGGSGNSYQTVIKIKPDGTVDSAASFGASGVINNNRAVAVDSNDNIFIAGEGPSMWSSSDAHVMKLTSSLTKTWDDFFGEGYGDEHFDIATNGTDAYAVGESTSFALNWSQDPKGYLVKYNSSGGEWKTLVTTSSNYGHPRGVSSDGNDIWVIGCEGNKPAYIANFSGNGSLRWSKSWGGSWGVVQDNSGMDIDCNSSLLTQSAAVMYESGKIKVLKLTAQTLDWQAQWEKASTDHGTENPGYDYSQGLAIKLLSTGSVALLALGSVRWTSGSYQKSFYIIVFDSSGNVTVEKEFRLTNSSHYLGLAQDANKRALVELSDGKIVTAMSYYTGSEWKNSVFKFDPTDTTTAINGTHGDWIISAITDSTTSTIGNSSYNSGTVYTDTNMSMYFKSGYQGSSNGFSVSSATVVEGTQQSL